MLARLRILCTRVFVLVMVALLLLSMTGWGAIAPTVALGLFSCGVLLVAVAALGRLWCALYIAGYKNRELITVGPYSMTRNPLYFFSFLGALGLGLISETFTVPAMVLCAFAVYYPAVIRHEEHFLQHEFGERFGHYAQQVPRFFPRLSIYREPEQYLVNPGLFRKHIYSDLWFVWAIGILEVCEELHELKILPTFFRLY